MNVIGVCFAFVRAVDDWGYTPEEGYTTVVPTTVAVYKVFSDGSFALAGSFSHAYEDVYEMVYQGLDYQGVIPVPGTNKIICIPRYNRPHVIFDLESGTSSLAATSGLLSFYIVDDTRIFINRGSLGLWEVTDEGPTLIADVNLSSDYVTPAPTCSEYAGSLWWDSPYDDPGFDKFISRDYATWALSYEETSPVGITPISQYYPTPAAQVGETLTVYPSLAEKDMAINGATPVSLTGMRVGQPTRANGTDYPIYLRYYNLPLLVAPVVLPRWTEYVGTAETS